jgi:hypothetical protein
MNPDYDNILKDKSIRDAIKDLDVKTKASVKGYAIAKVVKKKKYKKINGVWS